MRSDRSTSRSKAGRGDVECRDGGQEGGKPDTGPIKTSPLEIGAYGVANSVLYYQTSSNPINCNAIVFGSEGSPLPDGTIGCNALPERMSLCPDEGGPTFFAPVSTVDISSLRLVPPFHLEQGTQ
jgi:hypothetical protein